MKEADLYLPVKRYLTAQGYRVMDEVHNCDVFAVRGDESPVVVELKIRLNLEVLLQAVDRVSISSKIYIGVPAGGKLLQQRSRSVKRMLRMLGMGLLVVEGEGETAVVRAVLDPAPYTPRQSARHVERLLGEFERRVGDPTPGGSDRKSGIMTAYRQRALEIAAYLRDAGPSPARRVSSELNAPNARAVLYRDVYGWFDRESRGVYALSPRGRRDSRSNRP